MQPGEIEKRVIDWISENFNISKVCVENVVYPGIKRVRDVSCNTTMVYYDETKDQVIAKHQKRASKL